MIVRRHEHEAIFFMSLLPLFQLMNLYVMFSCPGNIKRFITVNSLELCEGMTK